MLTVTWRWGKKMNRSKVPGHYLWLQVKVRWFVHVLDSEASSSSQLMDSHCDLTVRSWLWAIAITEVQQKLIMPLVLPPLTPGHSSLPSKSSSQIPSRNLFMAKLWQRATSLQEVTLPLQDWTSQMNWWGRHRGCPGTRVHPALQRTPSEISENLIAFCHWMDKCWASRMSNLAQLSWHSCSSTLCTLSTKLTLVHKYTYTSMWFCFSISVINCRKSGLYMVVGSKVSTKGIDIKYSKSYGYEMCQLGMEISILGVY